MEYSIKVQLDAFIVLRKTLKNNCRSNICPDDIINFKNTKTRYTFCKYCLKYFSFLNCKDAEYDCPCLRTINPDELFLRLDEVIEELQEKFNKQYSC